MKRIQIITLSRNKKLAIYKEGHLQENKFYASILIEGTEGPKHTFLTTNDREQNIDISGTSDYFLIKYTGKNKRYELPGEVIGDCICFGDSIAITPDTKSGGE